MLYRFKELTDATLHARDREVGGIKDIYFDDRRWKVRYVVADTGGWFTGRKILISPTAFGDIDRGKETIRTNLTKDEIESSPAIGEAEPVSRKMELAISKHYGWPNYWAVTSPTLDTPVLTPSMHHARVHDPADLTDAPTEMIEKNMSADEPALRSADEVR